MGDGMNCKPGDLAVIVRADHPKVIGWIVTVVGPAQREGFDWSILADKRSHWMDGTWACMDSQLRPIRDNPGKDETLDWCPVPTKETA
jgi:hypothetical protein